MISAAGQAPGGPQFVQPRDRITSFIDNEQTVRLRGNLHPLAQAQHDAGVVAPNYPMEHMVLTLLPDPAQQNALAQLVEAQHNPDSPYYHQWLTPEQYAGRFGVSDSDVAKVTAWLATHGLEVEEVTAGHRSIIFSGTATQVESAFHTQIHAYKVGEEVHHANASDPQIPAALAQVVGGIVSLHDFRKPSLHTTVRKSSPAFTSGGSHYLTPADMATIYDLNPLYQQSINGTGQSVAIVARSNIKIADVRQFRTAFGLPANDPQIIVNGADPGISNSNEETEADLDVEWSGATAKNATIKFVVSKSTNSSDGVDLSAQYIVNNNLAPVMSTSFGLCEQWLGSSENNFLNSLWQQAASQGITVLVSSGDNGAAGCDSSSASTATNGRGVNGLCSTPYSICVGGTQFADASNPSLYWSSSNAGGTQASALSYIPEAVWNESGGSGLWASGGGVSTVYSKPAWQTGTGVPSDGKRDVPDVSLTAAGHDGYLIYQEGGLYVVGGTSAASPSFAGIMALVVQSTTIRQGNANTVFYPLATKQGTGGASVLHDITSGSNSVPGQSGFNATAGYDQATGLGSVDAAVMVAHWGDASIIPAYQVTASANSITVIPGSNTSLTLTSAISGGFNSAVAFTVAGLPAGVSATFTPAKLAAPGSGTSTLKLTATSTAAPGVYSATVTATSGSTQQQVSLAVTVAAAPTFALGSGAGSISLTAGTSNTVTFTITPNTTFNSTVSFSATGLPSGVTASFAPASLPAPGSGSSVLTLNASSTAKAGTYSAKVSAASGTVKQQTTLSITVNPFPTFTLSSSATSTSAAPGSSGALTFTTAANSTFSNAVTLSASGLPAGLTVAFTPSNVVSAPGSAATVATFSAASSIVPKAYAIAVSASGGGVTQKQTVTLNVPGFTLTKGASTVTTTSKANGTVKFTTAVVAGFNSAVAFSISGLPSGVTGSFSSPTLSAPGSGSSTLTLSKGSGATGNSTLTVTATAGSFTQTATLTLTVK